LLLKIYVCTKIIEHINNGNLMPSGFPEQFLIMNNRPLSTAWLV
jgi:hypothetical protein